MNFWTTKHGLKLLPKEMTTGHIKNCMRAVEKKVDKINIDSASSCYMKCVDWVDEYTDVPIYADFQTELKFRNDIKVKSNRDLDQV